MTSNGPHMSNSTPKQEIKYRQLKVKFQDQEETFNEELHAKTCTNKQGNYFTIIHGLVVEVETWFLWGDPNRWSGWRWDFQSIIDYADISRNAKMQLQHLQNAVNGRAKEAIEGYGYSG